jgi:quercetin dioxygenase-like cupin family protein
MFEKQPSEGFHPILEGVLIKTRAHGGKTLLAEFRLQQGADIPSHAHPQEQTGVLISGGIELTIGEAVFSVAPGDTWCILENVPHGARALTDSVAMEAFSPVRDDYLKFL